MSYVVGRARDFAIEAHKGQVDKNGLDYFTSHVEPVAHRVRNLGGEEIQVAAAYLHDVVEDTNATVGDIVDNVRSIRVGHLVGVLTRKDRESYPNFIYRVCRQHNAIIIKIADVMSNLEPERLMGIDVETRERLTGKYGEALRVLWKNFELDRAGLLR